MRMKRSGLGAVLAAVVVTACVSQGAFDEMEVAKNKEIDSLRSQRGVLDSEVQNLRTEKAGLERDRASLQQQQGALETQQADLRKQIEALEQQKAQLQNAGRQTQSQYDALVKNLTEEVKKGQLQVRQYRDMLTVDVAEQLLFDSGRADLKESGKAVLKKVGEALK